MAHFLNLPAYNLSDTHPSPVPMDKDIRTYSDWGRPLNAHALTESAFGADAWRQAERRETVLRAFRNARLSMAPGGYGGRSLCGLG